MVYYIKAVVLPGTAGNMAWGYGIGLSMLVAAFLSPILGAMADARANKRAWLATTALAGATSAVALALVPYQYPWAVVALFFVTSLCFELSLGFYNAFLPELADEKSTDMISAYGFGLGYVGGGIALLIGVLILALGDRLGFAPGDAGLAAKLRTGLLIMGLWWGLFSIPAIVWLKDRGTPRHGGRSTVAIAREALREVSKTLRNVRVYRTLAWFLLAYLIYNDGVQTVISQSSVFAIDALGIAPTQLILVVLLIQFAALPGAVFVGWLSRVWGQKPVLLACIVIWIGVLTAAFFVTTIAQFWIMAGFVALVMGGTQSVSRAIMARLTPASRSAEFFGFFNLSGKATSFAGPMVFATVMATSGSAHVALVSLLAFFAIGGVIIIAIDLRRGDREAQLS